MGDFEKMEREIFDAFDEKKTGHLRRQEASDAIRCCGYSASEAQIRQAIKTTKSNPGKVDFTAFTKILAQLKSTKASKNDEDRLRAAFASIEEGDYNSGLLNIKELEHILMSNGEPMKQSDLDEVFKVVSLHNGTDIDYEDLITLMTVDSTNTPTTNGS